MRVLLIEDEPLARLNLIGLLRERVSDLEVVGELDSVAAGVDFFGNDPPAIDLAFCDIHLGDGLSFHLFERFTPNFPIIFTTAFDQYALQAFSVVSLDYLLKPLKPQDLDRAIQRYHDRALGPLTTQTLAAALHRLRIPAADYRKSFLLQYRNKLLPVAAGDIRCVYILDDLVYAAVADGPRYLMTDKLEVVEGQLDPAQFFRINRQLIVARSAVVSLEPEINGRYLIGLWGPPNPVSTDPLRDGRVKLTVSKAKVSAFKRWLAG